MEVLYISMVKPYKNVPNGGGQTFYYYINALSKCEDINITLISKMLDNEDGNSDIKGIKFVPIYNKKLSLHHPITMVTDIFSKVNPYNKRGTTLRKSIYSQIEEALKNIESEPDVVILEFTQMLLMIDIVKKYFPKTRIFASEHDVSFLRCKREYENETNVFKKIYRKILFKTMLKNEVKALKKCDLIMPHNEKDKQLLVDAGIKEDKIFTLIPNYKICKVHRSNITKDILFYGAMNRRENYESAIWFAQEVMPLFNDKEIRFIIAGANPTEELKKLESQNIVITGFVEDISKYFESCICMVAPLISGAGIKIKVIEAMAAGVPVLTNDIGIEGIPAINEMEYFHCSNPNDYVEIIEKMICKEIDIEMISSNAMKIVDKFNLQNSFNDYYKHIKNMF